jgi:hypothetical protein
LESMETESVTADEVARRLSNSYDLEESGDIVDIVLARLVELCALGLVEQV